MLSGQRHTLAAAGLIVLATLAAYANSLPVPFQFDDTAAIIDNPTIRQLWPLTGPLTPLTTGTGAHGRPLVNLSLAINYAIGGEDVRGYHAFNVVLHALTALLLFGIVRRTWSRADVRGAARNAPMTTAAPVPGIFADATTFGFVMALLWAVHPLLTESVTCIIQRTEVLVGFFYLLTIYLFVRGVESARSVFWFTLAVASCLAGMASKEVMVTAPVLVLFYDRTFVAGTFRVAWLQRWPVYLGLATTWLLLASLMLAAPHRGGTVGFGLGVTSWDYLLTQCEAITRYLKLSLWPDPLVVDYGTWIAPGLRAVLPQAIVVVGLGIATLMALRWNPRVGFLGFWFFGILAPSSSFVPLASQTIAEHRMYLPLIAVITLLVGMAARWIQLRFVLISGVALALVAAGLTAHRNTVYRSEAALWEDTVAKRPDNARAHNNLGRAYYREGRWEDAITSYRESLRRENRIAQTHLNLGLALMRVGRLDDAVSTLTDALRITPAYFQARLNLGIALIRLGRAADARAHLAVAAELDPRSADAHFQSGVAGAALGRWEEAVAHYRRTLEIAPHHAEALSNWGGALVAMNEGPAAIEKFTAALRLRADQPDVHFNLGLALTSRGRTAEARTHYAEAVRLNPEHADALLNLGIALGQAGDLNGAILHLQRAVALRPNAPVAHSNLGLALLEARRPAEALASYEMALRLAPDDPQAHYNVGYALLETRGPGEARGHFAAALRLQPDFAAAREMLRRLDAAGPP